MKKILSLVVIGLVVSACDSGSSSSANVTLKGAGAAASLSTFLPVVDPAQMKIKVFKFAVSTHTDCSDMQVIYEDSSPAYQQMLANPTIGSGTLADGEYPCIAMEVSDQIKFTTNTTEGSCTAGSEYTIDVCRSDNSGASTLIDGTAVTCAGTDDGVNPAPNDDKVAIYMSTTGSDSNLAFIPSSPFPLTSAFTVAGAVTATFVVDGSGKVDGSNTACGMNPPVFGFR